MSINILIKNKIKDAGISVNALEKNAHLKQGTVQNIIYGRSKNPSINTLLSIADSLNCPLTEIVEEKTREEFYLKYNGTLYLECLSCIADLLKKKNLTPPKNKILSYVDETYLFSIKKGTGRTDVQFAEFIIEKEHRRWNFKP